MHFCAIEAALPLTWPNNGTVMASRHIPALLTPHHIVLPIPWLKMLSSWPAGYEPAADM
jgi:hypothetical protein